jgi:hypothetical protein
MMAYQQHANPGNFKNNSSGYRGVTWHKRRGMWQSQIGVNSAMKFLGYFINPEDAARKYNEAALQYHGIHAAINEMEENK